MDEDEFDSRIDAAQRGDSAGAASSTVSAEDQRLMSPVYRGRVAGSSRYAGKELPDGDVTGPHDETTTVADAYDDFDRMSPAEQRKWAQKLEGLGIIEPGNYNYGDLKSLWQQAVDQAADIYRATSGEKKVTPQGYLDLVTGLSGAAAGGPTKTTRTDTSTTLTTKHEARARITDAFRAELGRDPNRREVRAFYRALNSKQKDSPTVSTSTAKSKGKASNEKVTTDSTSRGGVDVGAFTQNYVDDQMDAESDDRAAATEYYDALLGLAGGGG